MNPLRIALLVLTLAATLSMASCSAAWGQPLGHHYDSLDWLVLDSPVVVRARIIGLKPINGQPLLSELEIEVLESIRGRVGKTLQVPVETQREQFWFKKYLNSKRELMLFLVKRPRGYQEPFVAKVIADYEYGLYYYSQIDLQEPKYAFSLDLKPLRDSSEILRRARELAKQAKTQPKPRLCTIRLPNIDTFSIPLHGDAELLGERWRRSQNARERGIAEQIIWGFKRLRNRPFQSGYWYARLTSPGGDLRFGLRLDRDDAQKPYALIINGPEVIRVTDCNLYAKRIQISFPHYDSVIDATINRQTQEMTGVWRKFSGKDKPTEMPFFASMKSDRKDAKHGELVDFYSRWQVKFSSSDDPAVAEFDTSNRGQPDHMDVRQFGGTIMTTTGDYRYLAGDIVDGRLELSVFDGAHAFLFRAERTGEGKLKGDFWSRDSWHETWTAVRDQEAKLPDAFEQTRWTGDAKLKDLRFPDLDGRMRSLADPEFAGKVRIITVIGSWCPNCHDSAAYLSGLHKRYADQGLSIVGLAFELTGDFERNAQQVKRYADRHGCQYPILIAGLADKAKASKSLPILDRVRSYPTTIFLNAKNEVISIHTGFTGPATGAAYEELRQKFESIIEKQLKL